MKYRTAAVWAQHTGINYTLWLMWHRYRSVCVDDAPNHPPPHPPKPKKTVGVRGHYLLFESIEIARTIGWHSPGRANFVEMIVIQESSGEKH